jgi:E3 ubiquitin-protein ligase RNF115/126
MEKPKKYWCFSCNKECQIIKSIEEGDEVYLCSLCKNSFVEEIEDNNNQTQAPQNQPQIQSNRRINITINNNNYQTSINNNRNHQDQYKYGMDNTFLFLPSTVNYVQTNDDDIYPNIVDSVLSLISPGVNTLINSLNLNDTYNNLVSFLNNHNNDFQFNNLVNILMSMDMGSNSHPPASERAINNLKKIEVNENNINNYKNITCNICLDNFEIGNTLRILECNHEFHEECILTWLKSNNTCPICRHELESNDPNYERRKNNHRENLRNLHRNNNNNNNNGGNSGTFA